MRIAQDVEDVEGIERRAFADNENETARLAELRPKMRLAAGRVQRHEAYEYGELYARQCTRRELVTLRRRIEDWTTPDNLRAACADEDEAAAVVRVLRDLVTVLDERIMTMGAHEKIEDDQ